MSETEFRTPEEVAAVCRVSRRAVYDWLREGKLKGYRAGTRWLIRPEDLDRFLTGQEPLVETTKPDLAPDQRVAAAVSVTSRPQAKGKRRR